MAAIQDVILTTVLIPQVLRDTAQSNQRLINYKIQELANYQQTWGGRSDSFKPAEPSHLVVTTEIDVTKYSEIYLAGPNSLGEFDFSPCLIHKSVYVGQDPESAPSAPRFSVVVGKEISPSHFAVGVGDNVPAGKQVEFNGVAYVKRVNQLNPFGPTTIWYEPVPAAVPSVAKKPKKTKAAKK